MNSTTSGTGRGLRGDGRADTIIRDLIFQIVREAKQRARYKYGLRSCEVKKLMSLTLSRDCRLLLDFLQSRGYIQAGRGISLKTGVKAFFRQELSLDDADLHYIQDTLVPVKHLVETIGNGILIFICKEHIRQ
jgi:hypothetical protein